MSLQGEWTHLQRVINNTDEEFSSLEKLINTKFIPDLLDSDRISSASLRLLLSLPVKIAAIGVPKLDMTCGKNHNAFVSATEHLSDALLKRTPFNLFTHAKCVSEARNLSKTDWECNVSSSWMK